MRVWRGPLRDEIAPCSLKRCTVVSGCRRRDVRLQERDVVPRMIGLAGAGITIAIKVGASSNRCCQSSMRARGSGKGLKSKLPNVLLLAVCASFRWRRMRRCRLGRVHHSDRTARTSSSFRYRRGWNLGANELVESVGSRKRGHDAGQACNVPISQGGLPLPKRASKFQRGRGAAIHRQLLCFGSKQYQGIEAPAPRPASRSAASRCAKFRLTGLLWAMNRDRHPAAGVPSWKIRAAILHASAYSVRGNRLSR